MTNTPDTTPEAVDQLADDLECAARISSASKMICGWMDEAALTLRALSAERDREKAYADQSAINLDNALERAEAAEAERGEALNQLDSARHSVDVLEKRVGVFKAENARLREALTDMRDDKIAYRHASHFRRRAAVVLARHQKEKDT
jgi:hypothetical protein